MAGTKIADIVFNTAFDRYFQRAVLERSAIIKSGIASPDQRIAAICAEAGFGGKTINMPFWNTLSGDAEVLSDSVDITVNALTAGQDVAVILRRAKSWGLHDLAAEIAGDDPIKVIADKLADFWARQQQKTLFRVLDGVFASNVANNASDLVLDITGETGDDAVLNADSLLFAAQLLGDAKQNLTAVAVNSQAETVLNIVGSTSSAWKPADTPGTLPSYNGRSVIMDDSVAYDPSTGVAEIFLFGAGAVAINEVPMKTPIETERSARTGGGLDVVVTRRGWINHVRGIKWTGTSAGATPTDAELATAANWTRVWDRKDIRVVKLIARLAPE
jgi:hypothetical protein